MLIGIEAVLTSLCASNQNTQCIILSPYCLPGHQASIAGMHEAVSSLFEALG